MSHTSIADAASIRATHTSRAALLAVGCLVAAAIATSAMPAQADPRHHYGKHGHHKPHPHGYGTVVIQPAWPRYAYPPVPYPPPRASFHRHHGYGGPPPWLQCRAWQGPVWTGYRYEHVYGTICLMPDGTWQLVG